jgi:uncharacterized protein YndB with AHSA1/START domain
MTPTSSDRIHKQVTLDAPRSRVYRALTDAQQFSAWFGVELSTPFAPGADVVGKLMHRGTEFRFTFWIEKMEPERFFSFRWHPYAIDKNVDYSAEPTTLVTFTLEDAADGATQLTIEESGFDAIPESRRMQAFEMNSGGWNAQAENLRKYVAAER